MQYFFNLFPGPPQPPVADDDDVQPGPSVFKNAAASVPETGDVPAYENPVILEDDILEAENGPVFEDPRHLENTVPEEEDAEEDYLLELSKDDEAEAIQIDAEKPLTDENLAVSQNNLDEKQYFYELLSIPLVSDDESPVQAFFSLLEGPEELKQQVIDFATTCMNEKRTSGTTPTDSFLQNMHPET